VPHLVEAGYAFLGAPTRYLNNDADALHERLLVDVAASVAWLRARGFRRVVLLANSGGGSLFAFYLAQAGRAAADRLAAAPSGDRVPLAETDMPMADGIVLLAAHLGEGCSCSTPRRVRGRRGRPDVGEPRDSTCTTRRTATAR
jgi:hypothetical protein